MYLSGAGVHTLPQAQPHPHPIPFSPSQFLPGCISSGSGHPFPDSQVSHMTIHSLTQGLRGEGTVPPGIRSWLILEMTRSAISCLSSSTCSPIRGIELSITCGRERSPEGASRQGSLAAEQRVPGGWAQASGQKRALDGSVLHANPRPSASAGNDPCGDSRFPAVQSKSTPWPLFNSVCICWASDMLRAGGEPLLTFSALWGTSLCPLLSHLPAPTQDWSQLSELWPKGKVFHKAGSSEGKGLNYDKKMTWVGVNSRFGEKREEARPVFLDSSRVNCREISSTGRRLLLKAGHL